MWKRRGHVVFRVNQWHAFRTSIPHFTFRIQHSAWFRKSGCRNPRTGIFWMLLPFNTVGKQWRQAYSNNHCSTSSTISLTDILITEVLFNAILSQKKTKTTIYFRWHRLCNIFSSIIIMPLAIMGAGFSQLRNRSLINEYWVLTTISRQREQILIKSKLNKPL